VEGHLSLGEEEQEKVQQDVLGLGEEVSSENDSVHSLAEQYLRELHGKGMTGHRVVHGDKCKCEPAYIEDTRAFVARIEREQSERYEASEVPMWFVLKSGHKYFYALKGHEIKWTYDINLAHTEHAFTVEGLICLLESYNVEVTKFPAPEKRD
jgi:hypothetical protein